jgi:hypothetical protein
VKKVLSLAMMFLFTLSFLQGQITDKVDKKKEDGVEVIINHLEPYKLEGKSFDIKIEEELVIDLEDEGISDIGLFDILTFGMDSKGFIYLVSVKSQTYHIFKFNRKGEFLESFGKHGQGPGEVQRPVYLWITERDQVFIADVNNTKFVVFSPDGKLVNERHYKSLLSVTHPLINGKFITFGGMMPVEGQDYIEYPLNLCSENLEKEKKLDSFQLENPRVTGRISGIQPGFGFTVSKDVIYTGNESRGYEILAYDLDGTLIRKIRKKYKPVAISEDFKKIALKKVNAAQRKYTYFPNHFPPFRSLFSDDFGRLFVLTFEEGERQGENWVDIFSPEGIFIGRISLNIFQGNTPLAAFIRADRLCCTREKENGYMQFVLSKVLITTARSSYTQPVQ